MKSLIEIEAWAEFNFSKPKDKVEILTQSIWYNSNIKIDNQVVCYKYWFNKGIKYIHNIVEWNIEKQRYCVLTCKEVNNKFNCNISQFAYCAIVDAIPVQWREDLKSVNMKLDVVSNYKIDRLVKMTKVTKFVSKCFKKDVVGEPMIILDKWINEGFSVDIDTYYECFNKIYKDLISVKMRMFQYKLLHRKLALNPWLFKVGLKPDDNCSICRKETETILHLFCECDVASWYHWRHLKISAGPGQRIPMEIPGYGGSLFQSTSGVKI